MLNSDIRTIVDRQALSAVFKDPRTLLAIEATMKTVQDTPAAVNAAQADATAALGAAATAQADATAAIADAASAQASAAAAQVDASQALVDAAAAQGTANTALTNAATAQTTANNIAAAEFVTISASGALANERVLAGGTGVTINTGTPGVVEVDISVPAALGNQTANRVYAGPGSGAAAAPAFRALVTADLPIPPTFSANRGGTNQTIATGSFAKVQCGTEVWDTGNCYDNAVNYRFTPTTAGKYLLTANAAVNLVAPAALICSIYKNGAEINRGTQLQAPAGDNTASVAATVDANGSTDYFEMFVFQNSGSNATLTGLAISSWFQGSFITR